ncbi:uncharacterized protein LOC135833436 [Planococcus citri]|uniref:uncharacterized protein LOC135833436 n=1 Tax=Planococcus citri TaxID=170843 RepID=UPI0031F81EF2
MLRCNLTNIILFVILQFLTLSNSQEQEQEQLELLKDDPQYEAFKKRHVLTWPNKQGIEFIHGYKNENVPPVISVLKTEPKIGEYTEKNGNNYESKAAIVFESFYTARVGTETQYRCLEYNQKIELIFQNNKPIHFQTKLNADDFKKSNFKSTCKFLKDNLVIPTSYEYSAGEEIIGQRASIDSSSFNTTDGDLSNSQGQEPEPLKDDPQYNAFVDRHILKYDNKLASEFFNAYLRSNRTVPPVISVVGNKNQVPMLGAYNLINGDLYESKAAIAFESFYTKQVGTEQLYRCLSYNQKIQIRFKGTKPTHFETILNKDDFLKSNFRSTCGTLLKALNLRVHPFYENNAGAPIIGERASIDSSSFNTTDGEDLSNSQGQEPEPLKDDPQYDAFVRRHILKYDNKGAIEFFNGYLHSKKPVPDIISVVGNKYQVPMLGAYNLIKGDLYESKAAIAFESFYTKQVGTEQLYRCLSYNQKIQIKFKGTKPTHFETRLNKDDFLKSNFRSTCGRLLHADNLRIHPFYENNAGAPIIEEQAIIGSSSFNTTDGTGSLINGTIAKENENPSETIIAPSN